MSAFAATLCFNRYSRGKAGENRNIARILSLQLSTSVAIQPYRTDPFNRFSTDIRGLKSNRVLCS